MEWEYPCAHPQDVHWLADGTILAAVGLEAQIIRPDLGAKKDGEVLWRVKSSRNPQFPLTAAAASPPVMIYAND